MNLSIKKMILLVVGLVTLQFLPAQEAKDKTGSVRKHSNRHLRDGSFGGIYAGYSLPVPLWKKHSYNSALDYSDGFSLRFLLDLSKITTIDGILMGYEFQQSSAVVTNYQLMGNYEELDMYNHKFLLGYGVNLTDHWQVSLLFGVGGGSYKSISPEPFNDHSVSYSVLPEIKFRLNDHFGFYVSSEVRMEKLEGFAYEYHGGPDFGKSTFWVPTIGVYIR